MQAGGYECTYLFEGVRGVNDRVKYIDSVQFEDLGHDKLDFLLSSLVEQVVIELEACHCLVLIPQLTWLDTVHIPPL